MSYRKHFITTILHFTPLLEGYDLLYIKNECLSIFFVMIEAIDKIRSHSCNEVICPLKIKSASCMLGLGMRHIHSPNSKEDAQYEV